MIFRIAFQITDDDLRHGRLDRIILARHPSSTRALVAAAFAEGGVAVNGIPYPKGTLPSVGSVVTLPRLAEQVDRTPVPQEGSIDIVWENAGLLAVNKPGGQPCHPLSPSETGTLANFLVARFPETATVGDDPLMPGLLHRIDAGTSGIVLCARTQVAFDALRRQFTAHTVEKVYTAIVHGRVQTSGGISGYLAHCSSRRGRMRCVASDRLPHGERAMFAETFYRPLDSDGKQTALEVTIYTGVTHQIRCQLASIGHPIVGDATYGTDAPLIGSYGEYHLLHATAVAFTHFEKGGRMVRVGTGSALSLGSDF